MLHCCRLHLPALGRALQRHHTPFAPSRVCARICLLRPLGRVTGCLCSSSHKGSDGAAGDGSASDPAASPHCSPAQQRQQRRRRGSLSPLERLSQLIPAELLSEEVEDLRVTGKEHSAHTSPISSKRLPTAPVHPLIEGQVDPHRNSKHLLPEEAQPSTDVRDFDLLSTYPTHHGTTQSEFQIPNLSPKGLSKLLAAGAQTPIDSHQQTLTSGAQNSVNEMHRTPQSKPQPSPARAEANSEPLGNKGHSQNSPLVGQCPVFKIGDLCLAEFHRKYYLEFKKMFTLAENSKLLSNWGWISHREIMGKFPGQMLKTSVGFPLLFRKPSLEEFVLFMKRGPTISYPKVSMLHEKEHLYLFPETRGYDLSLV